MWFRWNAAKNSGHAHHQPAHWGRGRSFEVTQSWFKLCLCHLALTVGRAELNSLSLSFLNCRSSSVLLTCLFCTLQSPLPKSCLYTRGQPNSSVQNPVALFKIYRIVCCWNSSQTCPPTFFQWWSKDVHTWFPFDSLLFFTCKRQIMTTIWSQSYKEREVFSSSIRFKALSQKQGGHIQRREKSQRIWDIENKGWKLEVCEAGSNQTSYELRISFRSGTKPWRFKQSGDIIRFVIQGSFFC